MNWITVNGTFIHKEGKHIRDWRRAIKKRDKYICQMCGSTKKTETNLMGTHVILPIHAHHIKPIKDYPGLALDVDNGITLCEQCHKTKHKSTLKDPCLNAEETMMRSIGTLIEETKLTQEVGDW